MAEQETERRTGRFERPDSDPLTTTNAIKKSSSLNKNIAGQDPTSFRWKILAKKECEIIQGEKLIAGETYLMTLEESIKLTQGDSRPAVAQAIFEKYRDDGFIEFYYMGDDTTLIYEGLTNNATWEHQHAKDYLETQNKCLNSEYINPNWLAEEIVNRDSVITLIDTREIFIYNKQTGLYESGEAHLQWLIHFCMQKKATKHKVNEIIESLKRITMADRGKISPPVELIPLDNGLLNFYTKLFVPHNPKYFFTTKHPISYKPQEPNAEANPIDLFLQEVTESPQETVFLKELVGYCFYRAMPFHIITIIVGAGGNGKSVFLNILRNMIGQENISERTLQELAEDRFSQADLYNKNANIVGDLPAKMIQDTGLLKRATGNDVLTGQRKWEHPFTFKPYAKIICATNEAPELGDVSDGIYRRLQVINFPNTFYGKEKLDLEAKLSTPENLLGFFMSCIDAFKLALDENGFIIKETIDQKREKYMSYSNSINAFCQLQLDYDPESEITTEKIYEAYKLFCQERKLPRRDERYFFQTLYRFFGNKVYKKRRSTKPYEGNEIREYVIIGVIFREIRTSN